MQNKLTRRTFISAAGALTALGTANMALADEVKKEMTLSPDLMGRTTLFGVDDVFDSGKDVAEDVVKRICTATFTAPSAGGSKSLQIIVVRSRETMQALHGLNPDANQLETCPVCLVLVEDAGAEGAMPGFFQYDAGLAAMAALAQATREGLTTAVMECPPLVGDEAFYDYSFIGCDGERHVPQLMVALGYPAVDVVTSASVEQDVDSRIWDEQVIEPPAPEPEPEPEPEPAPEPSHAVFTMPAEAGTGYEWTAESTDESVLALTYTAIEEHAGDAAPAEGGNNLGLLGSNEAAETTEIVTGGSTNYVFSFEAQGPGTAEVYVNYARPWEESDFDVSIACTFTVDDDLNVFLDYYNGPEEYADCVETV